MKKILAFLLTIFITCMQAKSIDKMIGLITASDLEGFQTCCSSHTFSVDELLVLKNLNESVLDKRKDDWNLHQKRQMYDWRQELLLMGTVVGFSCFKGYKKYSEHKSLMAPNASDAGLMLFCLCLGGFAIYFGIKLIDSRIRKKGHSEDLYKNSMLINAELELLINQAKNSQVPVPTL
jgi:hypothetical protein